MSTSFQAFVALFALSLAAGAQAQTHEMGQHPAVIVKARAQAIDPNLFIVQPPASTTWVKPHANGEHPAVLVARHAASAGIDSNTFQVQPPASTTWTMGPAADTPLLVARTASTVR